MCRRQSLVVPGQADADNIYAGWCLPEIQLIACPSSRVPDGMHLECVPTVSVPLCHRQFVVTVAVPHRDVEANLSPRQDVDNFS
jgi:hypothetical protein